MVYLFILVHSCLRLKEWLVELFCSQTPTPFHTHNYNNLLDTVFLMIPRVVHETFHNDCFYKIAVDLVNISLNMS